MLSSEKRLELSINSTGENNNFYGKSHTEETLEFLSKNTKEKCISPFKVEHWLRKGYSESEAIYKIKTFRKLNKEYWISRGFSDDEAIIKVSEFQKENSKKYTNKIKNGEFTDVNTTQIGYWIKKGFTEEESKLKVSERQKTFTLEKCMDKYGKDEGTKKYNDRQEKWQQTLNNKSQEEINIINSKKGCTLDNYINKYGIIEGTKNFDIASKNILFNLNNGYASKESLKIFIPLYKYCRSLNIKRNDIYFGINGSKEYFLRDVDKIYFYDFTIKSLKIIIEYNGIVWHVNDSILSENEILNFKHPYGLNGKDVLEKDIRKEKCAIDNNFKIFKIWSNVNFIENLNFCKSIIDNNINEM